MRFATLAFPLALAACNQPTLPSVGETEVPAPPAAVTSRSPAPEACPAVPIATLCNAGEPCWKNPHPIATTTLASVWSIGCTAWAVGRDGLLLRRTPQGWQPQPSITTQSLSALAGTAEDDVWAVGMNSSIFHFDGARWTQEAMTWNSMPYQAAWTSERGVVYVAGFEGVHRFEKKNGRTTFTTLLTQPETHFTALVGRGKTLTALAGEQTMGWRNVLWSFDGSAWTKTVLGSGDDSFLWSLTDIDGALYGAGQRRSGRDQVGYLSQVAPSSAPSSVTNRSIAFGGLAARSSQEIIVVGTGYPDSVLRFDGLTFTPIIGVPQAHDFRAISQSGRDYFLVGKSLGRIHSDTFIPESEGTTDQITGVVPLANGDVWLSNGWRSTRATGDTFVPTFTEPNRFLSSVAGLTSDDLWATDAYGGLWHFDGTSWSRPTNAPNGRLGRITITSPGAGFAVGSYDLWRLTGSTWTSMSLPTSDISIHDLLVGTDGMLMVSAGKPSDSSRHFVWRLDAATGVATAIPAPQRLRLLAGLGTDDVFGIGDDSLFHFDGTTWSRVGALPQEYGSIMSAVMREPHQLIMGTSTGRIVGWTGSRYFARSIGVSVAILGLTIDRSTNALWASGEGGTVVLMPW